jgi:hypothetical protein
VIALSSGEAEYYGNEGKVGHVVKWMHHDSPWVGWRENQVYKYNGCECGERKSEQKMIGYTLIH